MHILVTGGAGFIGSHLVEALLKGGHSVAAIDNFNSYYNPEFKRQNIAKALQHPNFTLFEGDITEREWMESIFSNHSFDMVVHLAARAGVRASLKDPYLYQKVNVEGSLNLLECCRRHKVNKFTFGSTSSVYGLSLNDSFSETDPTLNPVSPYAATKIAGEALCSSYHQIYKMDVAVLRFFSVYGPRGRPDMAIYQFSEKMLNDEAISVFGDGTSHRDYTYVDDIVQGIVATTGKEFGFEIFNLGESDTTSLRDLIALLESTLGKKAQINRLPDQPGDVPRTFANIDKSRKMLGYQPQVKIPMGIPLFTQWFLKNRSPIHV